MRSRALRRRYGRSAFTGEKLTFGEEYVHDHAEIVGAAAGAGVGALIGDGAVGAIGAVIGGLAGAAAGLALRRRARRKVPA